MRQRSDELIEDLEHELSGIITEYLHVRVTYRHSGFPHQPIQKQRQGQKQRVVRGLFAECDDGIAGIKTTIQTTAIGTIKRHNAASPWSQPLSSSSPQPGSSHFLEVIASHWGPDNAHAVMQRIIRSKSVLVDHRISRLPTVMSVATNQGDESDIDEFNLHQLNRRHDNQDHVRRSNHQEELPLSQDDKTDEEEEEEEEERITQRLTPRPAIKKRTSPFLPVPRRQASLSHLIERELAASRGEESPISSEDTDRDGELATSPVGLDDDEDERYNGTMDGPGDDKEVKVLGNIHTRGDLEETIPQGTILRRDSTHRSLLAHPPPPHDHRQHSKPTSRRKRVVSFFQPWSSSATLAGVQPPGVMDPLPLRVHKSYVEEGKERKGEEVVVGECQGKGAGNRGGSGVRRITSRSVSLRMKRGKEKEREKEREREEGKEKGWGWGGWW